MIRVLVLVLLMTNSSAVLALQKPSRSDTIEFVGSTTQLSSVAKSKLDAILDWSKQDSLCRSDVSVSVELSDGDLRQSKVARLAAIRVAAVRDYLVANGARIALSQSSIYLRQEASSRYRGTVDVDAYAWMATSGCAK